MKLVPALRIARVAQKDNVKKQRELTEQVAFELYQTRLLLGRPGDNHSDWEKAEKIVKSPIRRTLFASNRLNKKIFEPMLVWANSQPLFGLLEIFGNASIIIAVLTYIGTEKQRRDAEVLNAWQTITNAHGQTGSGGRIQALEFLNASPGANWRRKFPWICAPLPLCTWPAERLDGINLSVDFLERVRKADVAPLFLAAAASGTVDGVYLVEVKLPRGRLRNANLSEADMRKADLEAVDFAEAIIWGANLAEANMKGANLWRTNLEGSNLQFANLEQSNFEAANLEEAVLENANLVRAVLWKANLKGAYLSDADLKEVNLTDANLEGASLHRTNLERADLFNTNLEGAGLWDANLQGVQNLSENQLFKAKLCRTILPATISLNPNRDCKELGIDPEAGEYVEP